MMTMQPSIQTDFFDILNKGTDESVLNALRDIGSISASATKEKISVVIAQVLTRTHSNKIRNAAALALADLKAVSAVPSILQLLRHPDIAKASGTLLFSLTELEAFLPIDVLVGIIKHGSFEARSEALSIVGEGRIATFNTSELNDAKDELSILSKGSDKQIGEAAAELLNILSESVRFHQLGAAFKKWRHENFQAWNKGLRFAGRFAHEFRLFIGAPQFFEETHLHENPGKQVPYVRVMKAIINEEKQTFSSVEPEGHFDVLTLGSDGYFHFILETALEMAFNTWPKQHFPVLIAFKMHDDNVDVRVTTLPEGKFEVTSSQINTWYPIMEYIYVLLMQALDPAMTNKSVYPKPSIFIPRLVHEIEGADNAPLEIEGNIGLKSF